MAQLSTQIKMEARFLENLADLENAIYSKTTAIMQERTVYQTRILKAGMFYHKALNIYSRPLLSRKYWACLMPDRLANLLSLAAPTLPEHFYEAIRHIILLPELVLSPSHLLTHVYVPQQKLIAFYLCPARFLPGRLSLDDFEKNASLQKRMGQAANGLIPLGLWGKVLDSALYSWQSGSTQLHKFLLPSDCIHEKEIHQLQELDALYTDAALAQGLL